MWISKKIAVSNISYENLDGEVTYSSSNTVNVQNSSEYRNISFVVPKGIAYSPLDGDKTVIIPVGDKYICAGVVAEDKNLKPGEIMLYSNGGASLILNNDGKVLINGVEFKQGED